MTVENQTTKVTGLGNGVATVFSFSPMAIYASTDLKVTFVAADGTETTLAEGTGAANYSVAVSQYPGTGSVTYPASGTDYLATGEKIVIKRKLTIEQQINLENQGGYFPDTQEQALDRLTMVDLQQQEELDRCVKVPISNPAALATLSADLVALAAISDDISAVAAVDSEVATVAGISANVTTVAGISANVTTVAGISANVTTVAGISGDVTTCADNIAAIQAAPAEAAAAAASAASAANAAATIQGFKTFSVAGQSDVVADQTADTLTLAAGTGIAITTDASTDTITITATGGGTEAITAGENLAAGDAIYLDDANLRGSGAGKWYKIDTDATGPVKIGKVRGIVLATIASGNTGSAQVGQGVITGLTGLTAGQLVYASGTAGAMTQTEPAVPLDGTQNAVVIMGRALTTTTMQFEPWHDVVFQARNSALASGSSITVEHWTDGGARERVARAYITAPAGLTTDQMPVFSDYTSGDWTITVSNDSNGAAWYAGDNGTSNYWNTNAAQGQWWATENTGAAVTIGGYSIQADEIHSGRAPQSWTYEGWNGSAWVVLDTRTNVGAWSASQVRTYTLASPITLGSGGTYSKTQFNITAHYGGTTLIVDEFQQLGISTARDEPVDIGSETIDASATTKVTVKFADTADANQGTKTTFYNRTNATRDLIAEVTL